MYTETVQTIAAVIQTAIAILNYSPIIAGFVVVIVALMMTPVVIGAKEPGKPDVPIVQQTIPSSGTPNSSINGNNNQIINQNIIINYPKKSDTYGHKHPSRITDHHCGRKEREDNP